MHDQDKFVKFYDLLSFLELPVPKELPAPVEGEKKDPESNYEAPKDSLPLLKPLYQFKNNKKLSTMLKVGFKTPQTKSGAIEGLLIADKVGEIHFLNIKNL